MIIAVASTRKPKVEAVRAVVERLSGLLGVASDVVVESAEVESGVSETPTSTKELITGARNRALALAALYQEQQRTADFFVGLEGGFNSFRNLDGIRHTVLENWVCVFDGEREAYASGGAIEVPEFLADAVVDGGESLAKAIDSAVQRADIRSSEGTWGVLTKNFVTRQGSFESALINAFAPWYNKEFYRTDSEGTHE